MAINPFRASNIRKAKSELFKGGVKEKEELARVAGSGGISKLEMEKKLEIGYKNQPTRRKAIINHILGSERIKKDIEIPEEDIKKLSPTELKSKYQHKVGIEKVKRVIKERERKKQINIILARESEGEVKKYISEKGAWNILGRQQGEKKVKNLEVGSSAEDINLLGQKERKSAGGTFASDLVKDKKSDDSNTHQTGFASGPNQVSRGPGGINNPPSSPINRPPSPPPKIPLSK